MRFSNEEFMNVCKCDEYTIIFNESSCKLNRNITSKSISANNISEKLAYYYSELNMIHPFQEGNGRTQKIFIEKVAD